MPLNVQEWLQALLIHRGSSMRYQLSCLYALRHTALLGIEYSNNTLRTSGAAVTNSDGSIPNSDMPPYTRGSLGNTY